MAFITKALNGHAAAFAATAAPFAENLRRALERAANQKHS
jgi:hypothetical protein